MRKTGLFILGLALMMTGASGIAAAQNKGPNFSNLLKVTAPRAGQQQTQEMTEEEKAKKKEAFYNAIEEQRAASAKEMQGYDEDLHGWVRFGMLTCEDGYIKTPDGSRCVEPKPVENGRWKNGRVICENGYIHLLYLDGTNECLQLPEVEHGRYEGTNLVCLGDYAPIGLECVPVHLIASTDDITYDHNFCPEGFEQAKHRQGCYEREKPGGLKAGYDDDSDEPQQLELNPYATQ